MNEHILEQLKWPGSADIYMPLMGWTSGIHLIRCNPPPEPNVVAGTAEYWIEPGLIVYVCILSAFTKHVHHGRKFRVRNTEFAGVGSFLLFWLSALVSSLYNYLICKVWKVSEKKVVVRNLVDNYCLVQFLGPSGCSFQCILTCFESKIYLLCTICADFHVWRGYLTSSTTLRLQVKRKAWGSVDTLEEMNLGGTSNVDLTEAARLMKQSAGGAGVPNQQVPPPMMLMQQAVAMQQFQFQQALLMQQVRRLCQTY